MNARRPGFGLGHVRIEGGKDAVVQRQVFLVIRGLIEARPADLAQELDRVMAEAFPQVIIDAAKDARGFRLPCPPQVISKLAKTTNTLGQVKVIG